MFYLLSPRREGFTRGTEQGVCQMLGYVSIIANFMDILYNIFDMSRANYSALIIYRWVNQSPKNTTRIKFTATSKWTKKYFSIIKASKWQQFTDRNCVFEFEKKYIPLMYKIVLNFFHLYSSRIELNKIEYVFYLTVDHKNKQHIQNCFTHWMIHNF